MIHLDTYAADLLSEVSDSWLLIENMLKAGLSCEVMNWYSPGLIEKIIGERVEHLSIGDEEYDFRYYMACIEKSNSAIVTLETPKKSINRWMKI